MKRISILIIAIAFGACSTPPTPQQVATVDGLLTAVSTVAVASGKLSPAEQSAALYGVAALEQAYAGTGTAPTPAVVVASAGNPVAGSAIAAALPASAPTQAQVNTIYKAAATAASP